MNKKAVVIGLLGTTLDSDLTNNRWDHWRPTVSLALQKTLPIKRFDFIFDKKFNDVADIVSKDFTNKSPSTLVVKHVLNFPHPWDFESVYAELLRFAHEYKFDTDNEDYFVHISTGTHVMQICLFLLVESRIIPGKLLQTGYEDNDVVGFINIIDLDLSKYSKLLNRFQEQNQLGVHFLKSGIHTANQCYNNLIDDIAKISINCNAPILITGPSGVGKTHLARLIFEWKKRNHKVSGAFTEINCATLKGSSAMSTLFGHVKGAYTGATEKRKGLLSVANGGLLFLDEIGELGLDEQAMLLIAIEEKHFYPLGSDEEISSDFQLICGTNADINKMVKEGRFRADLLARINLWTFHLMGLKDRPEDIEPNLQCELEKVSTLLNKKIRINKDAYELFLKLATAPEALWTENFRELAGCVLRMAVLSDNGVITCNDVNKEFSYLYNKWQNTDEDKKDDYPAAKKILGNDFNNYDLFDIAQLECVLNICHNSKTMADAGRKLFSESIKRKKSNNNTDRLKKYLSTFNISWTDIR